MSDEKKAYARLHSELGMTPESFRYYLLKLKPSGLVRGKSKKGYHLRKIGERISRKRR